MTVNIDATIPALTMTGEVATSELTFSIPAFTADLSAVSNKVDMNCVLGSFVMNARTGVALEGNIPSISMVSTARNSIVARLAATLPSFNFTGQVGKIMGFELPAFTMSGSGTNQVISNLVASLPTFVADMQGDFTEPTDLTARIPSVRCAMTAYTMTPANMSLILPSFRCAGEIATGLLVTISANIPRFKCVMGTTQEETTVMDVTIPLFVVDIRSDDGAEEVLQFVRGQRL